MTDETVRAVDLFCGAGGLSTGLALACEAVGRDVELAAVNHWETAIATHERNHPWAEHYHSGVEALKPIEVFPEGEIEILIAAPSCTHHSKACGGQPVNPQDRMSPFAILDWIAQLRPRSVLVENVPEFRQWGPVIDGQATRNGQFFEAWRSTLAEDGLGYTVSHRTLTAADYGDPTTRKRLFIIARRDDAPIWPEPTHSEDGEQPGTEPWRPASEILDWADRGQSIWTRGLEGNGKRPLAANTMQRIAQGISRYAHEALEPFAAAIASLDPDRVEALQDDIVPIDQVPAIIDERDEPFLVEGTVPVVAPGDREDEDVVEQCPACVKGQHGGSVPRAAAEKPVPTVATSGALQLYEPEPFLVEYDGTSDAQSPSEPLPTTDKHALCVPDLYPWGLDVRYRMLQPRELAAAQGFPAAYEFAGGTKKAVTKQIGNAVPVNLATALCRQLLDAGSPTLSAFTSSSEVPSDD